MEEILSSQKVRTYRKKFGELPNTKHLENPALAIDVVLGRPGYISDEDISSHNYYLLRELFGDMEIVDWFSSPEAGQLGGMHSFKISKISPEDKISACYESCTAVVVFGKSIETNERISLLTHQSPSVFSALKRQWFVDSLVDRLREFKRVARKGTIDAVIAGGYSSQKVSIEHGCYAGKYLKALKTLGEILIRELEFSPRVVLGPSKDGRRYIDIALETKTGKMYIMPTEQIGYADQSNQAHFSFQWFEVEDLI